MKPVQNQDSQQPADPQRRQLLANLIAGGVVLSGAGAAAVAAEKGRGKGGKAGGKGGRGGKGAKGGRGGRGPQADPLKIATQLLDTYDRDGDNALNLDELKAAMAALYQVQGSGSGSKQARGGKGGKAGKGGKGKGAKSNGGVTPKKPGEA